jgi:hypothetical protein
MFFHKSCNSCVHDVFVYVNTSFAGDDKLLHKFHMYIHHLLVMAMLMMSSVQLSIL